MHGELNANDLTSAIKGILTKAKVDLGVQTSVLSSARKVGRVNTRGFERLPFSMNTENYCC
ncbi:hypothetical protein LOAG_10002 [Loa loa]|uniref:Uncharacterized protein n=1 Tax=Loa loa TaxID=7209 RepID=A0A1S0TQN3_LOALO|nr:hypothetical protein LOAG_10002 [Loa loa]EFO18491.1 hypothetical protein LOAG_10002 [Loa loa]